MGLTQVLVADNGSSATGYLYGLDLIGQQVDNNPTRAMLADGLGSVRTEIVNGYIQTVSTYDPYGNMLAQTGSSGTVYGFTGEQEDSATGLLYLRVRYYNPNLQVFMGRDAYPGRSKMPSTQHGYSYVSNNPINGVDPSGLCNEIGDELCWALAEQAWQKGLGSLGTLGTMTEQGLRNKLQAARIRERLSCPPTQSLAVCMHNRSAPTYTTPNWDHQAPYLDYGEFDKFTPDALVLGTSASAVVGIGSLKSIPVLKELSLAGVCGVDVLISLNELPSVFIYAGGGTGLGGSSNITPLAGGFVWELDGHTNYRGPYQNLSVDGSVLAGAEANLFRSPEAIPFDDNRPGSWGFTVAPNAGGGLSGALTTTCFIEVTTLEFFKQLVTGDFAEIVNHCRK